MVKEILLVLAIFTYIVVGLSLKIILLLIYPSCRFKFIAHWTKIFNLFLRRILRIKVLIEGQVLPGGSNGNFIISNHLGYLDGIVLGSIFPVIYISKSQVKDWPLFGLMTQVGETIFIDRKRKNKSADYIQEVTQMLRRKLNVLIFPEGTSTNGQSLLPFQSVHFQSPLNAGCPVLPLAITYTKINEESVNLKNRDRVCWYGQIKFYEHLRSVLGLKNIEAKVKILPKIDSTLYLNNSSSRKALSKAAYDAIAGTVLNSFGDGSGVVREVSPLV